MNIQKPLLLFSIISLNLSYVNADVKMPAVFGDHMVLQQDVTLPVWGWADAGEDVTVSLGDKCAKVKAQEDGSWHVDLDKMATSSEPLEMTVIGKNTLKFEDVLVGDVWVCSGQSNMAFNASATHNSGLELSKADDRHMRLFKIQSKYSLDPEKDVISDTQPNPALHHGKWVVCNSTTSTFFSAVGYNFGRALRNDLNRPVGLIGAYQPGTPAQDWISVSGLEKNGTKDPQFREWLDTHAKAKADSGRLLAEYSKAMDDYKNESKRWENEIGITYNSIQEDWQEAVKKAKAEGNNGPPRPQPSRPKPQEPEDPTLKCHVGNLYNGMIAPIIPYAIKGVIWYQGESNTQNSKQYEILFPLLISDWREKWGQGDFSFLFVQLASWKSDGKWPGLREAQSKTLFLPQTGMAVAIDIGDPDDVHPKDKYDVALRLLQAAKKVAYGQDVVYSGPTYDSMKIEGRDAIISFKNIGGGLIFDSPPWAPKGKPEEPSGLKGFSIAGDDRVFSEGNAQIIGDKIVVACDTVPNPKAVRYGWADVSDCNLYNKEKLPAVPFRTDAW